MVHVHPQTGASHKMLHPLFAVVGGGWHTTSHAGHASDGIASVELHLVRHSGVKRAFSVSVREKGHVVSHLGGAHSARQSA